MRKYKVIGPFVNFHSGALSLSKDQYASRAHALEPTKTPGEYLVLKPVQFKRGEEVGYDGEVSKALLQDLSPVEGVAKPKAAEGGEEKVGPGRKPKAAEGG